MNPLVLAAGTLIIVLLTWIISVKDRRFHGIARFFSFESIFILFLLNYQIWFKNPFTLLHIISWILLILSIFPALTGFILLNKQGKPDNNFENTSQLVKTGIYKFIRHPLYLSLILLGTGIMLKDPGKIQLLTGLINLIALWFTALIEEKEMISKFGESYKDYMKDTKMFIPFIV